MSRLTGKNKDGYYGLISDESIYEAIQKLGALEDACDDLTNSQKQIPKELEELRLQGKEKTVRYKETMTQKLINSNIIMFLERYGLYR